MILEAAIANLSRNLDIIIQNGGQNISSHSKLKEEALSCLVSLIEKAPISEYINLLRSEKHEILLGYLVHVLCQLAKDDKSRSVKYQSLEVILSLIQRLEALHDPTEVCSLSLISSALPGVTSTLFRLLTSDTKLPKKLLVIASKTLTKLITLAFVECVHKKSSTSEMSKDLESTCDNLSIRLNFLINYIISNSRDLPEELIGEILELCSGIVIKTNAMLTSKCLKILVRYIAFVSSSRRKNALSELKIILMADHIKDKILNSEDESINGIESMAMSSLFKILDNLESNSLSMLRNERHSELSVLLGFFKLLPDRSLTTFLELQDRRTQLLGIFNQLLEFSTQQPFLFLTGDHIDDRALEKGDKICTVEKRFTYLDYEELTILGDCCEVIGNNCDWLLFCDILKNDLAQFSSPNNLYLTHLMVRGCLQRPGNSPSLSRFALSWTRLYIEKTQELLGLEQTPIEPEIVLRVVIAIETLATLVGIFVANEKSSLVQTNVLRIMLCPLLNWSSSSSRAISEASLSTLIQISHLYHMNSVKSLIEANIDYIVDGVSQSLNNFVPSVELTNVLAITLKLSSMETFYYFKDVYERIFRLMGTYCYTEKSKPIALLFFRTLTIISEWDDVKNGRLLYETNPLEDDSKLKSIIYDLSIDRRLQNLENSSLESERLKQRLENMELDEKEQSQRALDDLKTFDPKSGDSEARATNDADEKTVNNDKPQDVALIEKIVTHCVHLMSSNHDETKILALRASACGFKLLKTHEDTLLPLVHQVWGPLVRRLTADYTLNLEINLSAFECLMSMALFAKDFIKRRTLDTIIPRLCLFLKTQAEHSKGKKDYGPYCMTLGYKCQLKILRDLGALAYHIQIAYSSLWRVIRVTLRYLDSSQVSPLRDAARESLHYMMALDADCVWYLAKKNGQLNELPFDLIYESPAIRSEVEG